MLSIRSLRRLHRRREHLIQANALVHTILHGSAAACRCPYYETAQDSLNGALTGSHTWHNAYWDALLDTNLTDVQCGISLPSVPNKFRPNFFADVNNPTCGEYLQLTSLYPGRGPCYPVLLESVDYFNRCSLNPVN